MHIDLGVSVFAIKELQKKRDIVGAGRTKTILINGRDLFFERNLEIFFAERLFAPKIDCRAVESRLRLLILHLLPRLVPFFALRLAHGALTSQLRGKRHPENKSQSWFHLRVV